MKLGMRGLLGAALAISLGAPGVLAQGTSTNAPPGSIWTYLGPTFGAAWMPPVQVIATCGGDAARNATTIQGAINQVAALGGGGVLIGPGETCTVNSTLLISTSQVGIACGGWGKSMGNVWTLPKCALQWTGAAGGTMLKIASPYGSTTNMGIFGNFVRGLSFDGNGVAATGLLLQTVHHGMYEGTNFHGFTGYAVNLDVVPRTLTNFGEPCDSQFNYFVNTSVDQRGYAGGGLRLSTWANPDIANSGCNASFNTFVNTDVWSNTGTPILIAGGDNNHFLNSRLYPQNAPAIDFSIHVQGAYTYPANTNTFRGVSTPSTAGTEIRARGTAQVPTCTPYWGAAALTSCTFGNTLEGLDASNGGGGVHPVVEQGAQLIYRWSDEAETHSAALPTVQGFSGLGTGGTGTLEPGSRNDAGWFNMTAGTGAVADGTVSLNLVGFMGTNVSCIATILTGVGPVSWAPLASLVITNAKPRTDHTGYDFDIQWHNPVALTTGTSYRLGYICRGMNIW